MTDAITYQILASQFNHPEQTEGQHANGPPNIFVRVNNGHWFVADGFRSISKVESAIEQLGFELFVTRHLLLIEEMK